jgi:hypothetical protein
MHTYTYVRGAASAPRAASVHARLFAPHGARRESRPPARPHPPEPGRMAGAHLRTRSSLLPPLAAASGRVGAIPVRFRVLRASGVRLEPPHALFVRVAVRRIIGQVGGASACGVGLGVGVGGCVGGRAGGWVFVRVYVCLYLCTCVCARACACLCNHEAVHARAARPAGWLAGWVGGRESVAHTCATVRVRVAVCLFTREWLGLGMLMSACLAGGWRLECARPTVRGVSRIACSARAVRMWVTAASPARLFVCLFVCLAVWLFVCLFV